MSLTAKPSGLFSQIFNQGSVGTEDLYLSDYLSSRTRGSTKEGPVVVDDYYSKREARKSEATVAKIQAKKAKVK